MDKQEKEGRDTEGRMGGGDKEQERKTGAMVMGNAQGSDSNIQVWNDGSQSFSTSYPLFPS